MRSFFVWTFAKKSLIEGLYIVPILCKIGTIWRRGFLVKDDIEYAYDNIIPL